MFLLISDLSSFDVKNEREICRTPKRCFKRSEENLLGLLGACSPRKIIKLMYPRLAKIAFHGISAVKIKCHLTIY